jgi:hypothetical protein
MQLAIGAAEELRRTPEIVADAGRSPFGLQIPAKA